MRTGRPKAYPKLERDSLYKMYHETKMTLTDMSKLLSMPHNSLRNYMVRLGIPLRNAREAHALAIAQGRMKGVQLLLNETELRTLYLDRQMSIGEIAEMTGCTTGRIQRAFAKWHIITRSVAEGIRLAYSKGRRKQKGYYLSRGYVYIHIPDHHKANKDGWVAEHVVVWEQANGKMLPEGWHIHHINGRKNDNRSENLMAMPKTNHHSALLMQTLRKRIQDLEALVKSLKSQTRFDILGD